MMRVPTMTVLALGWLGPVVFADDSGWKAAEVPKAIPAPKPVDKPVALAPVAAPAAETVWRTAAPVVVAITPSPATSPAVPDPLFKPATLPSTSLEPLTPPALLPTVEAERTPKTPPGPSASAEPNYPSELPELPKVELPKLPQPEPLPAPRAVPGSSPRPICNDTPITGTTLQRVSAVTPAEAGIPVRHHVFGSEPVRLSHDFLFRDLFGLDLLTHNPRAAGAITAAGTPEDTMFVQAEYLLWWANKPNIPVLATTNTLGQPGFLGEPGTQTLSGPGTFGPGLRDGFRIRAGGWWDECGLRGIDAGFFFLGRRSESVSFDSAQFPVISRPIFAPNINREFAEDVAVPNVISGRLDITTDSYLWGADVNFRKALCRTCDRTTGWYAGYRHLNLTESLTIAESLIVTGPGTDDPIGTRSFVQDRFETRNRFHGGQVGGFWTRKLGRFDWDTRAGIALGTTVQTVEIDGLQQRTRPGQALENFRGGLLATGPNLGTFTQSEFSVVPEITTNLGYRVTPNLRLSVGYNFLYWSNVVRPGDQIDRVVDLALVPNPPGGVVPTANPRPLPTFRQSDFWAHGVQFGIDYRW